MALAEAGQELVYMLTAFEIIRGVFPQADSMVVVRLEPLCLDDQVCLFPL